MQTFNRTKWNWNYLARFIKNEELTFNRTKWNWNNIRQEPAASSYQAFNRTKWNWNLTSMPLLINSSTFNRTKWNWNSVPFVQTDHYRPFNRTKWNWNSLFLKIKERMSELLIVLNGIEITNPVKFRYRELNF